MRLIPKHILPWRRRGHTTVASELGFLSPEERKELAKLRGEHTAAGGTARSRGPVGLLRGDSRFRRSR